MGASHRPDYRRGHVAYKSSFYSLGYSASSFILRSLARTSSSWNGWNATEPMRQNAILTMRRAANPSISPEPTPANFRVPQPSVSEGCRLRRSAIALCQCHQEKPHRSPVSYLRWDKKLTSGVYVCYG